MPRRDFYCRIIDILRNLLLQQQNVAFCNLVLKNRYIIFVKLYRAVLRNSVFAVFVREYYRKRRTFSGFNSEKRVDIVIGGGKPAFFRVTVIADSRQKRHLRAHSFRRYGLIYSLAADLLENAVRNKRFAVFVKMIYSHKKGNAANPYNRNLYHKITSLQMFYSLQITVYYFLIIFTAAAYISALINRNLRAVFKRLLCALSQNRLHNKRARRR